MATRERVCCREMLASRAAAGLARSRVKGVLVGIGRADAVDDGVLVMGELVNNAIAVSPPASVIRVFAGFRAQGFVVAVWDGDARMPVRRAPGEVSLETLDVASERFDRNGGWGLGIVESLAKDCWVERTDPGKWVCAVLDI